MPAPANQVAPLRPWVILLVDDEPDLLQSMKALLESSIQGVRVLTASSGRLGLELLDRERVDLILSDLRMPGMDGIEFLYQARRHHPDLPRVMLTAFGNEEVARRAVLEAFCSAFLSKGVAPEQLIASVASLLRYIPSAQPPEPFVPPATTKQAGRKKAGAT